MAIKPVSGEIKAQVINDNLSYLESLALQANGGPVDEVASISELNSKYPNGANGVVLVNGIVYLWNGNQWTTNGTVYQAREVAVKSVDADRTNFAHNIDLTSGRIILDKSIRANISGDFDYDSVLLDNPGNITWYKSPVKSQQKYNVFADSIHYLKSQIVVCEFKNGKAVKRYTASGASPSFTTGDCDYVHLSVNNTGDNLNYYKKIIVLEDGYSPLNYKKSAIEFPNEIEKRLQLVENGQQTYQKKVIESCRLIKDAGLLFDATHITAVSNVDLVNSQEVRYSTKSKIIKPKYKSDAPARIKIDFGKLVPLNNLTLVFKATAKTMTDCTMRIDVSQDDNYSNSNGTHLNGRYEPDWNYVKILSQMLGSSAPQMIKTAWITITSRKPLADNEIFGVFTFDAIIANMMMMPTVLFSLDQLHQASFDNGSYQYLLDNNIPFSLYCRNWHDPNFVLTSHLEWAKKAHFDYGIELGCYGGFGESNLVVANATDYKTAKDNLDLSFNKFSEIFGYTPKTYAYAQGKVTEINKQAVYDAGFKLGRGGQDQYVGYFDSTFKNIAMRGFGYSATSASIRGWIDNTIKYGMCFNIFTHGAHLGATEPDYMDPQVFRDMIDYLVEKRDAGEILILTHEEFYKRCTGG